MNYSVTRALLSASAIGAVLAAPAFAQENWPAPADDATIVVIEQVVLTDTFAQMEVVVEDAAESASAVATATGNTATALGNIGDVDFDATQTQNGSVGAISDVRGLNVSGTASAYTTAYGNAASSSTSEGTTFHTPVQNSNHEVRADSIIELNSAGTIDSTTSAAANVSSASVENGTIRAFNEQTGTADVIATTNASMSYNSDSATLATTASGNTLTSTGTSSTQYVGAVQVMQDGTVVTADSDVEMGYGNNVSASTTATANSVAVHNEWGFASAGREGSVIYQENRAQTNAVTTVDLTDWSGSSGSTAYGVGNSALISNVGSDTALFANQQNIGEVNAVASFNGTNSAGGYGYASATAIGNAATATLCSTCSTDATLYGHTTQTNQSNTNAFGYVTGSGGILQGAATAVGNSATYQTTSTGSSD